LRDQDSGRDDKEEGDDSDDAVAFNYLVVLWEGCKSIAHSYHPVPLAFPFVFSPSIAEQENCVIEKGSTIISHRLEIESHQIRQQEIIPRGIPGTIAHVHGVGRVCAAPGRRQVILRRHGDDGAPPEAAQFPSSLSFEFRSVRGTM
jgi:hypothetical protein